jgi:putative DNA primase/helicase
MSNYENYADVVDQLKYSGLMLESAKKSQGGILAGELYVGSTKAIRCDVSSEKKKQGGAYWLHELRLSDGIWLTGAYWLDHGNTRYKLELRKNCAKCNADIPLKSTECPFCHHKKTKSREIPKEQLEAHKQRMIEARKQAEAERQREIEKAASWASAVWRSCAEVGPEWHDYLERKNIGGSGANAGGVRIFHDNAGIMLDGDKDEVADAYKYLATFHGSLVIPACDHNGKVYGLQFILSREKHKDTIARLERDKCYWPAGMGVESHYWMLGGTSTRICLVAEGYATAMSIHEATGYPVAVAFAANNLMPVAKALRKRYGKRVNLMMCADDDWLQRCDTKKGGCGKYTPAADPLCKHCGKAHGKANAGVESASNAALAVAGAWVKPEFFTARPDDKKGPTDFNDLHCIDGIQLVRAQIEQKVSDLGWAAVPPPLAMPSASHAGIQPQGGGERTALKSMLSIDEGVERFAFVFGGKGTMFDYQEHILVPKVDVLDILPEHGWRDMRSVKKVVRMDEVGFDPAGTDARIKCNLWGGWPTTPKQGKCDLLLEVLEYLCQDEPNRKEVYDWALKWLAYPIQHPGAKMRTALVLHGPQGTGKNLFFEAVMAIYGEYGRIIDQAAIEDKFNDWAGRKLFMIADEVVARQELFHIKNKLKGFVTGEWIRINPKNVAAHDEKNHVNLVFLSNEAQPLVLEKDDRRYAVIHTPEKMHAEFYQAVRDEINEGGIAALHHYLLNLDLGDFDEHTKPPTTRAKDDLIELSMDSVGSFLLDWQREEVSNAPFCPALGSHLFASYRKHCDTTGERSPRSMKQFVGYIKLLPGWRAGESFTTLDNLSSTVKVNRKMVVPPNDLLLKVAKTEQNYAKKESENQATWLTSCFFAFANAGGHLE